MGDLGEDTSAVARILFRAAGTAVLQIDEELNALGYDLMGFFALDMHHEPDAAGIVLKAGVVQPFGLGKSIQNHDTTSPCMGKPKATSDSMFL